MTTDEKTEYIQRLSAKNDTFCVFLNNPELKFHSGIIDNGEILDTIFVSDILKYGSGFPIVLAKAVAIYIKGDECIAVSYSNEMFVTLTEAGVKHYQEIIGDNVEVYKFHKYSPIVQTECLADLGFDSEGNGDLFVNGSPTYNDNCPDLIQQKSLMKKYNGNSDLQEFSDKGYGLFPLTFGRKRIFEGLDKLNFDKKFFMDSEYRCPYNSGNKHYSMVPVMAIIKPDYIEPILKHYERKLNGLEKDMITNKDHDCSFFKSIVLPESLIKTPEFNALFGHGYTHGTLSSDGMLEEHFFLMEYKHAYLLVATRTWYNQ